ncbi:MAG: hypothetical protein JXM69_15605 [Anaerolineae bacterium]|nr:hypothetical protein [Anaerolineae bacterium]
MSNARRAVFVERRLNKKVDFIGAKLLPVLGYAAKPISDRLKKKGGELAVPPEGFYVEETEGPLLEGEFERATDWARQILAK